MIRPLALDLILGDLILGVVCAGMMDVALVIDVLRMHSHDTGNAADLGIPAYAVTDLPVMINSGGREWRRA